jgi:hypothetical protein
MSKFADTVLIFGGAGLVGIQVARKLAREYSPRKIIIASRYELESREAVEALKKESPNTLYRAVGGDIFLREEFTKVRRSAERERETETVEVLQNGDWVNQMFKDIFGPMREDVPDNIRNRSLMVRLIEEEKPDVVVDCINTATAISYQETRLLSQMAKKFRDQLEDILEIEYSADLHARARNLDKDAVETLIDKLDNIKKLTKSQPRPGFSNLKFLDIMLISQAIPQLVLHVRLLAEAMKKADTRIYVKVGTTGTGGMGMNIPYTHSEDKPSFELLSKTSVGFAHTGLLFLLARTPGAPIIKEIKPGAMIGYKKVETQMVRRRRKGKVLALPLYSAKPQPIAGKGELVLDEDDASYEKQREKFSIVGLNTGENGFFGLGEFEAITALNQMEFVTAEEVAEYAVNEIVGRSTGKDVITALDGSVVDPTYRGGILRPSAINKILEGEARMKQSKDYLPSIAIGQLGPPQLSKILYEAHLIKLVYPTIKEILEPEGEPVTPESLAKKIADLVQNNPIRDMITSIGMPILMPDGSTILRGPFISIPESPNPGITIRKQADVDGWAEQGWVDLRPANFARWIERFRKMYESQQLFFREGSSEHDRTTYIYKEIRIGEVAAWIFANELNGYRIR